MFVGGPGMYNGVLQRMGLDPAKQTTVRVLELPAGPAGRATIAFTRGLGLFGQPGENPSPAAVEFLAYATGPEGLAFWIGDSGTPPDYVPARPGLADQWLERHPGTKAFVVGLEYAQNYQPDDVPGAAYAEFYEMASRILPQALTGQLPVSDVLKSLQEEGNEILRNYR
jgi:ABC-type glycerol-3-phosphate transport system substrate-binding protein